MQLDDVRKTIEAAVSSLTPGRAQELAKGILDPGAAKEQVARTAADLLEWSHKSRERVRELVRHELQEQMRGVGVATQVEFDALRKRVRDLERAAGMTASGRRKTQAKATQAKATQAKATPRKKPAQRKSTTQKRAGVATRSRVAASTSSGTA